MTQQYPPGQPYQHQQPPTPPKRTKGILLAVAGAVVVIAVALALILTLTGGPDLSSPQATAHSWVDAVNDKDAEAVIDTVCPAQSTGVRDDAVTLLQESLDASPGGAVVQKVEYVDATTASATVSVPSGTTDTTFASTTVLELKRINGDWYVCGGGPTPMGG